MKKTTFIILICLAAAFHWTPPPAHAQTQILEALTGKKEEEKKLSTEEEVQQLQKEAQDELQQVETDLKNTSPENTARVQSLKNRKELLEELNLYYEQFVEAHAQKKEFKQQIDRARSSLKLWSGKEVPENVTSSFEELDRLADQLQINIRRIQVAENTLSTLKTSLEEAKNQYDQLEKERRRVKERLETNNDPNLTADLQRSFENVRLESKIAQAKTFLLAQELENQQLAKTQAELEKELLNLKIGHLRENVRFEEKELQEKTKKIQEEKKEISRKLQSSRQELQNLEKSAAQEDLSPPALEIFRERKQATQDRISVLAERFQRLDEIEETWRRRYLAFNDLVEKTLLTEWQSEVEQNVAQVQRQETLTNMRLSEIRKDMDKVEERINALSPQESDFRRDLTAEKQQLTRLLEVNQDYLSGLARESRLYRKFLDEISPQVDKLSVKEKAGMAWNKVVKVWNFEITSIDDKPITVQKLVIVLILLLLGYRFSKYFSRWMGKKIFPRFGLEEGAAAGIQTLIFYILVTVVTLIVLYIVNVPLTLFTVLGGAVAIGVGFGSQNIVRNFISGLILLMEQPIKVGDMVQVDTDYGTVERIGARSTRIRSFNNVHNIVPNSDFLEKKVINWTLSDDLVRIQVNVGVVYGSPTRDVAKLIRKAVDEHGKVIPHPEPIILFTEFGDNSLNFEVHFWIRMRTLMDRRKIESDIRYRIDSLFREAGIIIAFPQRDVHLDSVKPVEIRLLRDEEPSSKEKTEGEGKKKEKDNKDGSTLKERLQEKHGKKDMEGKNVEKETKEDPQGGPKGNLP